MIEAEELKQPGVRHGFFTRRGGVSDGIYDSLNIGYGSSDAPDKVAENRARVARKLSETVLPDLERHVVTSRLLTPIGFRDRLSSLKGAAFGLEPVLTQTAWFRPHNRSEDVENLFLVGAGTHPGAGLPGVISSAKVLDEVVPDPSAFTGAR